MSFEKSPSKEVPLEGAAEHSMKKPCAGMRVMTKTRAEPKADAIHFVFTGNPALSADSCPHVHQTWNIGIHIQLLQQRLLTQP